MNVNAADWFAGKEVAFAFGLNLSVARLGSVFNNLLSPVLADSAGVPFALWFGTILCASSVFCAMVVIPIDKGLEEKIAANKLAVEDSNLEVNSVIHVRVCMMAFRLISNDLGTRKTKTLKRR